jgi:competence protein ComER
VRIGVIGVGNMGKMLAKAFATEPNLEVRVFNRSPEKSVALTKECPDVKIAANKFDIVRHCDVIFICTKADDGRKVMEEIGPSLSPIQTLVTTISTIPCSTWEALTPARVAKVIPSIVQTVKSGILLVAYGSNFEETEREGFERLLRRISTPFVVDESQIRVTSDLTSCGPAFLSFLLREWAVTASHTGQLGSGDAEHLLRETLVGLANLIQSGMTFSDIIAKVAVPGGVTEAGLKCLHENAQDMFRNLHQATAQHGHGIQTMYPMR